MGKRANPANGKKKKGPLTSCASCPGTTSSLLSSCPKTSGLPQRSPSKAQQALGRLNRRMGGGVERLGLEGEMGDGVVLLLPLLGLELVAVGVIGVGIRTRLRVVRGAGGVDVGVGIWGEIGTGTGIEMLIGRIEGFHLLVVGIVVIHLLREEEVVGDAVGGVTAVVEDARARGHAPVLVHEAHRHHRDGDDMIDELGALR